LSVIKESEKVNQNLIRLRKKIFISYYVQRNLLWWRDPVVVEVFPSLDLISNEDVPHLLELNDLGLLNAFVMTLSGHHVEEGPEAVQRRSDYHYASFE
jgi:hypothetical protein